MSEHPHDREPPTLPGLPPGPWRVVRDEDGDPISIVSAEGIWVLGVGSGGRNQGGQSIDWIDTTPEVLRAIEALPALVEAARDIVRYAPRMTMAPGATMAEAMEIANKFHTIRDVLARIDGTQSAPG